MDNTLKELIENLYNQVIKEKPDYHYIQNKWDQSIPEYFMHWDVFETYKCHIKEIYDMMKELELAREWETHE